MNKLHGNDSELADTRSAEVTRIGRLLVLRPGWSHQLLWHPHV